MPEYLAPGVYVEEVSFRSKSIEGVSTTTTGFVGPARYGPTKMEPELLTSLGEFERIYGDGQQLKFKNRKLPMHNYLWHAARAFFEEGGKRLYVVRTFLAERDVNAIQVSDGYASAKLPASAADDDAIQVKSRFPGELGNIRLCFTLGLGQNILGAGQNDEPTAKALQKNDIVWIGDITSPLSSPINPPISSPLVAGGILPGATGQFYRAQSTTVKKKNNHPVAPLRLRLPVAGIHERPGLLHCQNPGAFMLHTALQAEPVHHVPIRPPTLPRVVQQTSQMAQHLHHRIR